jgi:hypothetical protein
VPEIALSGGRQDSAFVLARMLYPADDTRANQYVAARVTRWIDEVDPEYDPGLDINRILWDAPSRDEIEACATARSRRGRNAGDIVVGEHIKT